MEFHRQSFAVCLLASCTHSPTYLLICEQIKGIERGWGWGSLLLLTICFLAATLGVLLLLLQLLLQLAEVPSCHDARKSCMQQ
jgi:hypothetical protein